jgi:putative membrane protein
MYLTPLMEYVKLLHVLFIMVWIGNLLALTRMLAYKKKLSTEAMKEFLPLLRRMYLFIGLPSLVLAVLFGGALLAIAPLGKSLGWLHMKLTATVLLIVIDMAIGSALEKGVAGLPLPSPRRFKLFHGGVGLLVVASLFSVLVIHGKDKAKMEQTIAMQKVDEKVNF